MQSLRPAESGFLFGLIFLLLVIGGFALSMAEGGIAALAQPTATLLSQPGLATLQTTSIPTLSPTVFPIFTFETSTESTQPQTALPPTDLPPTDLPQTDTPQPTPTLTYTPPPPPTTCPPPAGWVAAYIQPTDTLASLAQVHRTSIEAIRQGNCLVSDQLVPGSFLYLPALPTATTQPCGTPSNWTNYLVVHGDTLFNLSQRYAISVAELQRANCLGSSTYLQAGKYIKVPPIAATVTLAVTKTSTPTMIIIAQPTATPTVPQPTTEVPPTASPTSTQLDTPLPTASPVTP